MDEHDTVVITRSLPEHGLRQGDVGVIVHAYPNAKAFEVEFVTGSGKSIAVVTLEVGDLRPVADEEIFHVRPIAA